MAEQTDTAKLHAIANSLIRLAAAQLKSGPSPFAGDWPKTTPRTVIRALESDDRRRKHLARELRGLADEIYTLSPLPKRRRAHEDEQS